MAKKTVKTQVKTKVQSVLTGSVVALSGEQTLKVRVDAKRAHPLYKKIMRTHKNYMVHNSEALEVKIGDVVEIVPSRPISKRKSWALSNIVETAE